MCGRYRLNRSEKRTVASKFGVREEDVPDFEDELDNAPGSWRTVVGLQDSERTLMTMRWGFQMQIQGKNKLVFNTKSEVVLNSKLWKPRFLTNRCIVPASAFYAEEQMVISQIEQPTTTGEVGPIQESLFG
jgi:putative SOS response-associated peptidase YedK